jgi:hypothetical protein
MHRSGLEQCEDEVESKYNILPASNLPIDLTGELVSATFVEYTANGTLYINMRQTLRDNPGASKTP